MNQLVLVPERTRTRTETHTTAAVRFCSFFANKKRGAMWLVRDVRSAQSFRVGGCGYERHDLGDHV